MAKRGKSDGSTRPTSPDASLARGSKDDVVAYRRGLGKEIAGYLRDDAGMYQEYAAIKAGISRKTYWRWLDGEDEASEAFQREVLPALYEQARAAEQKAESDIASGLNGSSAWANWHKWKLEGRYRKIFGDLAPTRVELTGKDGGPIETSSKVRYVVTVPEEEPEEP